MVLDPRPPTPRHRISARPQVHPRTECSTCWSLRCPRVRGGVKVTHRRSVTADSDAELDPCPRCSVLLSHRLSRLSNVARRGERSKAQARCWAIFLAPRRLADWRRSCFCISYFCHARRPTTRPRTRRKRCTCSVLEDETHLERPERSPVDGGAHKPAWLIVVRPAVEEFLSARHRGFLHHRPRQRDPKSATSGLGYLRCGPNGAGHFVKMVHNGIENGIMAAYAEGFNLLVHANTGTRAKEPDAETRSATGSTSTHQSSPSCGAGGVSSGRGCSTWRRMHSETTRVRLVRRSGVDSAGTLDGSGCGRYGQAVRWAQREGRIVIAEARADAIALHHRWGRFLEVGHRRIASARPQVVGRRR